MTSSAQDRERAEQDLERQLRKDSVHAVLSDEFFVNWWRTKAIEAEAARCEERTRYDSLLREIDNWCSGENQVDDGENAEDALRYIQDAIKSFLAGASLEKED